MYQYNQTHISEHKNLKDLVKEQATKQRKIFITNESSRFDKIIKNDYFKL